MWNFWLREIKWHLHLPITPDLIDTNKIRKDINLIAHEAEKAINLNFWPSIGSNEIIYFSALAS